MLNKQLLQRAFQNSSKKAASVQASRLVTLRALFTSNLNASFKRQAVMRQTAAGYGVRMFSNENHSQQEVVVEAEEPILKDTEKREFKAETKKLLDIVAKSIYTDKEVFVRELLSNCSDALEKQRFRLISGQAVTTSDEFYINVITNSKERTITLFDTGVGMTRDEIIDNLGTIARSGSQQYVKDLKEKGDGQPGADTIIGQFGVGFYSSFIVADHVEVLSKSDGQKGVRWVSDGSGEYEVSDVENIGFERGTKITLKLRADSREFSTENEIEKIIKKFSQFISYPIKLNGQILNNLQAIWYRDKREVGQDEYERFYEQIANTKVPYRYYLHYSTDVPLAIKALIYIPNTHNERFGMMTEGQDMNLYSRKILIKAKCSELLPNYLRFVKGVVDCEDLPLNISRETYQDSSLMHKLRNVLTRRVLKLLDDESKRDPEKYNKWFNEFQNFLKEGLTVDPENAEPLFKLLRFNSTFAGQNFVSLDDYISKMKPNQEKIYFIVNQSLEGAMSSPFMEPFKGTDVPVLILTNNIDEVCFQQQGQFKNKKFSNVETSYDEIAKDLGKKDEDISTYSRIPEDDVTPFSLWLKNELQPSISKVQLSKRLKDTPAIVVGQMSSSMRMMMQMMEQQGQAPGGNFDSQFQNQTLEINPAHPIIVNLNHVRKTNPQIASLLSKQLLDNILLQSGVPFDTQKATERSYQIIEKVLDSNLNQTADDVRASRKLKSPTSTENIIADDEDSESVLSKTARELKKDAGKKIIKEHKVTEKDFKN